MIAYMPKSKTDEHITPNRVYKLIEDKWGLKKEDMFDPCPINAWLDGLEIPWQDYNYVNPPFDVKTLTKFVARANDQWFRYGNQSIMLLPSKTDQAWFHDYILSNKYEILWIKGRLKFKGEQNGSTQPHFLVRIA